MTTLKGFYAPVDMSPASSVLWNTVKGGSTVPLKFEIFAGTVEQTSTSAVPSLIAQEISCVAGSETVLEPDVFANTGGTALRYDSTSGFFIANWQTPKGANHCYQVIMTASDSSKISRAFFKTK